MNIDQISTQSMAILHHHRRRPPATTTSPPSKPNGARLLSFFLSLIVMSIALTLFFLFAGIAVFTLIFLFIIGKLLRRRSRRHLIRRPHAAPRRGLSLQEMKLLPWFGYDGVSPSDCAVCLDGIWEGELCRALPGCKHVFHMVCVDRWLERSEICPICRGDVTISY